MNKEDLIKDLEYNIDFFTELAKDLEGKPWFDKAEAEHCRRKTVEPLKRVLEFIRELKE